VVPLAHLLKPLSEIRAEGHAGAARGCDPYVPLRDYDAGRIRGLRAAGCSIGGSTAALRGESRHRRQRAIGLGAFPADAYVLQPRPPWRQFPPGSVGPAVPPDLANAQALSDHCGRPLESRIRAVNQR
jgi:hypothetical protein